MKHNIKITIILLLMFLATQFIGLYVLKNNPLDIQVTSNQTMGELLDYEAPETTNEYAQVFQGIIIAFVIAIGLLLLLTHFKVEFLLKIWFLLVVIIALCFSFLAIQESLPILITMKTALIIALGLSIPLAIVKIYGQNFLIHNLTELFIYPGIAVIFVPLLNIWTIIALLILISLYDMWAVWKSKIMQKMAKFQIDKLKVFSGFFVPYISKKTRQKLRKLKKSELKKKRVKANVAILGGGDVIFPMITAGVMMKTFPTTIIPAILVIFGALLGLGFLFFFAKKKKFYPAMPYISTGIFIAIGLSYLIF